jgi:hypothetical protein
MAGSGHFMISIIMSGTWQFPVAAGGGYDMKIACFSGTEVALPDKVSQGTGPK